LNCIIPALTLVSVGAFAADDDIEFDESSARVKDREFLLRKEDIRHLTKEEMEAREDVRFERSIFMRDSSAEQARLTIHSELERVIDKLDQVCQLTELQKQKLQLAGRADQEHFFDRVDEVRLRSRGCKSAEFQSEIQNLQIKTVTGILGSDSFFAKSVRTTLIEEQLAKLNESRRSNRIASIEKTLGDIDRFVKLNPSQRDALSQLLMDETPYSPEFENFGSLLGNSERVAMMYYLSQMAGERVRPILDPLQWETLQPHLQESRRYRLYLTQRGLIASVADNAAEANPARAVKELK